MHRSIRTGLDGQPSHYPVTAPPRPLKLKLHILCGRELALGPPDADLLEAIASNHLISPARSGRRHELPPHVPARRCHEPSLAMPTDRQGAGESKGPCAPHRIRSSDLGAITRAPPRSEAGQNGELEDLVAYSLLSATRPAQHLSTPEAADPSAVPLDSCQWCADRSGAQDQARDAQSGAGPPHGSDDSFSSGPSGKNSAKLFAPAAHANAKTTVPSPAYRCGLQ